MKSREESCEMDVEDSDVESEIAKHNLRATLSEPNPRERRARWLKDKIRINNCDKTDSGFQEHDSLPQFHSNNETISDKNNGAYSFKDKWLPRGSMVNRNRKLRTEISLPNNNRYNSKGTANAGGGGARDREGYSGNSFLSRQNGVRYSLRTRSPSQSPCSISSESEASQGECENGLGPPSHGLLSPSPVSGRGVGGRKQSVFFASYEVWNEDSVAISFRDLSPSITSILEAAWSGPVTILKELLQIEENLEKIRTDGVRDGNGRTPLHLAALNGHVGAVELLLQKGAEVEAYDTHQKATPLSCAASCGSLPVVEILLDHGADVNAGYDLGKTPLHWSVQAGSVDCTRKLLECGAKQNPPLVYSETPLHIASALGDAACIQVLLDYKADVTLCKGTNKSQALHLAAEEGSSTCMRLLLKAGASHGARDGRGLTPLHFAVKTDAEAVSTLLGAGADPNLVDSNGRTPLHCSIGKGSRAAEIVRLLVDSGADLDAQDNFGYSPLHLSAVQESSQCASTLLYHGADVTSKTKAGTSALSLLVRRIPDVMRYLVDRLDSAVTIHDHDPADPDCEVRLDFRAIVPNSEKSLSGKSRKVPEQTYYHKPRKETEFLTCLLAAGNKKILSHPLSEAFLTLKWRRVRKFFWASLLFQIALVLLFTVFVVEVYLIKCPYNRTANAIDDELTTVTTEKAFTPILLRIVNDSEHDNLNTNLSHPSTFAHAHIGKRQGPQRTSQFSWFRFSPWRKLNVTATTKTPLLVDPIENETLKDVDISVRAFILWDRPTNSGVSEEAEEMDTTKECKLGVPLTVVWGLLISFACMMGIKEIFQLLQAPLSYIVSSENWGQWALIASVTLTAWSTPDFKVSYWQYPAAACGIFLAWGLMLLQVGRFPALGLYVQMLGKVAANFGLFILAYACLLIAFALAFCVLFPDHPSYSSAPLAILKVLTMMVGEVDYEDLFYGKDKENDPLLYPITAHILHGAFVIIVTIVLMNLLVGLAVHDIQGLQKGAKLNRLSRQTALISRLESFIFSKRLQSCLPRSIGFLLQKSALLVPSSYNWSYYFRPNDPRDKRLPKELKLAALRLAAARHSSKHAGKSHPEVKQHLSNGTSTDAGIRRLEQRLDQLQNQVEFVLRSLSERLDKINGLIEDRNN